MVTLKAFPWSSATLITGAQSQLLDALRLLEGAGCVAHALLDPGDPGCSAWALTELGMQCLKIWFGPG
eukprot:15453908-Alexandrium_andersonii.AAC.1